MPSVMFRVPGVEGQRRPRAYVRNGHAGMYKLDADRVREGVIRAAFLKAREDAGYPAEPPEGAVWVLVSCTWPVAKGKGCEFTRKPDVDNVAKSVLDALNGAAYGDDSQVTRLEVIKCPREQGQAKETEVTVMWGFPPR